MLRSLIRGKTRILLAWIFAGLLIFSARNFPTPPGILICFLGACLRFWASGYLRKDNRPAVGGPYAFVRNPLYLGTYLMAIGTALSTGSYWLSVFLSIVFAAIYHFIILDEEIKLQAIFGEPYDKYCSEVPRFLPKLSQLVRLAGSRAPSTVLMEINPEISNHRFSFELAMKNKAYEAFASFAGLIGFVALIAYFWKK